MYTRAVIGSRHRADDFRTDAMALGHTRGCATMDRFRSDRGAFSHWTAYRSVAGPCANETAIWPESLRCRPSRRRSVWRRTSGKTTTSSTQAIATCTQCRLTAPPASGSTWSRDTFFFYIYKCMFFFCLRFFDWRPVVNSRRRERHFIKLRKRTSLTW